MTTTTDQLVMDKNEIENRNRLLEAVPHVIAWCGLADGLPLPAGVDTRHCSPSCSDYRASVAGAIYSAGFRLPLDKRQVLNLMTPLPRPASPPVVPSAEHAEPTPASEGDSPPPESPRT